jgi:hypothetical protein
MNTALTEPGHTVYDNTLGIISNNPNITTGND